MSEFRKALWGDIAPADERNGIDMSSHDRQALKQSQVLKLGGRLPGCSRRLKHLKAQFDHTYRNKEQKDMSQ